MTITLFQQKENQRKIKNGSRKSIHEHRCHRTSPICQGCQKCRQSHNPSLQPIDELLIHEVRSSQNSKMP
ncbi:uncharacterized protein LOC112685080 [Sipha flava]|uniref:Uncharacterized protein LOC112685080 n=1 Tax=Sipha flava TaxID=143950 RepID=A0A8B8FNW9_9HEMI|nr:uncharacterized protein LOC112685080 [Sipha flava]